VPGAPFDEGVTGPAITEAGSMPASFLSDLTQNHQIFDDFPIVRVVFGAHTPINCRNW
jgi:hypothetical protein